MIMEAKHLELTDGVLVDVSSVDELATAYEEIRAAEQALRTRKLLVVEALARHATGTARTERVRGEVRRVKIEQPRASWDAAALRKAWERFPNFRERYLKIDKIGVQMREFKKLQHEAGPAEFEEFRRLVLEAERGPSGQPRITIEE